MAADDPRLHPPESPPGISLEELAAAFAQAMGEGRPPSGEPAVPDGGHAVAASDGSGGPAAVASSASRESPGTIQKAADPSAASPTSTVATADDATASDASGEHSAKCDDPCPITPVSVLEAMLFVGNRDGSPLTPARAAELMRGVAPGEIASLVDELNARYEADGRPYTVVSEGSGYRLRLRPEFAPLRDRFYGKLREARLSQAAVDILAIVAYQQPLSAEQINKLRGKPSGHVLSQLVHRQLLRIERAGPRRTAQYYTTERFLRLFGLESLDDLPRD